jgi:SAM-dependent methyltransferase
MNTPPGYHETEIERTRSADLMRLTPRGYRTVLDAGARDGYFSRLLTGYFEAVTAVDLQPLRVDCEGVTCVQADLTRLPFPNREFDVVLCSEVLEHIPDVEKACAEIVRVARHEVVIGVPYRQDIRVSRTTCKICGKISPPWGHLNSFDEKKLEKLFYPLRAVQISKVSTNRERTTVLATWLMDLGGNPWGVYDSEVPCGHCGARKSAPGSRSLVQRLFSGSAALMNNVQSHFTKPHASWIHVVFKVDESNSQ